MTRPLSIKTKSIALFVVYLLALGAVYATFTVQLLRRESAAVVERLEQTGRLLGAEIDAYVESGRQRLAIVSKLPGLAHGLQTIREASAGTSFPAWTTLHYLFFRSSVFTGGVFLVDADGKVLWTEPPGQPWLGTSLTDYAPVGATLRAGQAVVSPGLGADVLLAAPHVVITAPIAGGAGETVGVLAGIVDLDASDFTKILGALSATHGRFVRVVDQHGAVVANSDRGDLLGAAGSAADEDIVTATTALAQTPWHILTGEQRATHRAELWRLQRTLLVLGAAVLGLAAAVGWPFIHSFVRSVKALTTDAEVMARGDLSRPVAIGARHDELDVLARTFERMRQQLARSRRALEHRVEERDELIRLKEEFLANVSHELRTPLNVIIGYSDLLHDDEPSPERRDVLTRLRDQAEHLFQLVRDLMTLSGLNTGKLEVTLQPVAIAALQARLAPAVDHLAAGKGVAFRWEIDATVPTITTDPLRLEQILMNLVTNAFKFTAEGEIVVRVRHDASAGRAVLEVADTGIGIAAAELPHIFDEFRQLDGSMSRHHGGMGLGLALVRRLAALLAGEITVVSTVGAGSTFTLSLPLEPPLAATARETVRRASDRSPERAPERPVWST